MESFGKPADYTITQASTSDATHLLPLVDDVEEHHEDIARYIAELSADKGYDSARNKAKLYDVHGIRPIIDNRILWVAMKTSSGNSPSSALKRTDGIYGGKGSKVPMPGRVLPFRLSGPIPV